MQTKKYKVRITDETSGGAIVNDIIVSLSKQSVTIQDIITARVIKEVEEFNNKKPGYFNGFIQPVDAEKTLNGFKLKEKETIDAEKQVYVAMDAFQKNGYFILIDNKQACSLEETVTINQNTGIVFIKLTQLIGG